VPWISDPGVKFWWARRFVDLLVRSQTLPPRAVHRCRDRYTRTLWPMGGRRWGAV